MLYGLYIIYKQKNKGDKMTDYIEIPHIGEVLNEEFLQPLNLSQNALATAIGVASNRINGIINGVRGVSADTDLRLTKYFGLTEGYFLRLQNRFDLMKSKREIADQLIKITPINSNNQPDENRVSL